MEEVPDQELGWSWEPILRPRTMFPAPPIISIPDATPEPVVTAPKSSFGLFWMDLGAAASHLRTSVERLLDHFGVVKTRIIKKKSQSKGRGCHLTCRSG
jgi:hypothetical protein